MQLILHYESFPTLEMNTFIIVSRLKKIIALKLSTDTHILKTTRCSPNFQRYNFSETFVTETRVIIIH